MVFTITTKNSVDEISGTVIEKNCRTLEAPSTEAASYSSRGTF